MIVLAICFFLAVPITNTIGEFTSPGTGQVCTLAWLADHSSSVERNPLPDTYNLVDDVTISQNDDFLIYPGETLIFEPTKRITINGDLFIYGSEFANVGFTSKNEVSVTPNILWEHQGGNTFDINYLSIDKIILHFIDENDDMVEMGAPAQTDDIPPVNLPPAGFLRVQVQRWISGKATLLEDWAYVDFMGDADGDGMPNWWEIINHCSPGVDDSQLDYDGDGVKNIDEYNRGIDPWDRDSDDDGLEDGDEETEGTNPRKQDSDGDTLKDGYEVHTHGSDPTTEHSDVDPLPDQRDNKPKIMNRRFAFLLEVCAPECQDVSQGLVDEGWEVYLYSECDYNNDGVDRNGNGVDKDIDDDVHFFVIPRITWNEFSRVDDDDPGIFQRFLEAPNYDVGTFPSDIVFLYLDAHGQTDIWQGPLATGEYVYEMLFFNPQPLGNLDPHTEEELEDVLNRIDNNNCYDLIWVSTCNSWGWENDLASDNGGGPPADDGDDLDALDRIVILTSDEVFNNAGVFNALYGEYDAAPNKGIEDAFDEVEDNGDEDFHYLKDYYTWELGKFFPW